MEVKMSTKKRITFVEDEFDLQQFKNSELAALQQKNQMRRNRRKILIGKIILIPIALATSVGLYYFLSILFNVLFNA